MLSNRLCRYICYQRNQLDIATLLSCSKHRSTLIADNVPHFMSYGRQTERRRLQSCADIRQFGIADCRRKVKYSEAILNHVSCMVVWYNNVGRIVIKYL